MSRCSCFSDQPCRMNSTASQSSSSGCDGRFALVAEIAERSRPARCRRRRPTARLTVTRAVSGFSGETSQRAKPSRLRGASAGRAAGRRARPAPPASSGCRYSPRWWRQVVRGLSGGRSRSTSVSWPRGDAQFADALRVRCQFGGRHEEGLAELLPLRRRQVRLRAAEEVLDLRLDRQGFRALGPLVKEMRNCPSEAA